MQIFLFFKEKNTLQTRFLEDLAKFRPKEMKHLDNMAKSCILGLFLPFLAQIGPNKNFATP